MSREGAASRLQSDLEMQIDRRKVSEHSRRKLAEAIRRGETESALTTLFEITTGRLPNEYPTVRDVRGDIVIESGVTDKRVEFGITIDGPEKTTVSGYDGYGWRVDELPPGEYTVTADVERVYVYDNETLEITEYDVQDATLNLSKNTMTIDPTTTQIGEEVSAPTITLTTLTTGGEL